MTTGHGALDLLNIYGNDSSSDDDVPSGRVSTKRCYKDDSDAEDGRGRKVFQPSKQVYLYIILKKYV